MNGRKQRFVFTIQNDIALLKETLSLNPWHFGRDKWEQVLANLKRVDKWNVRSSRTLKERVMLLLKQFELQQLTSKSGTEDECMERTSLLQSISAIVKDENVINAETKPEDVQSEIFDSGQIFDREERVQVDLERNQRITEKAPKSNVVQQKRPYEEDDVLLKRLALENRKLQIEERKLQLEEDKQRRDHEIEQSKVRLEFAKVDLERQREARLKEQLRLQNEMMDVLMQRSQLKNESENNNFMHSRN